jgi:hypothetical protein
LSEQSMDAFLKRSEFKINKKNIEIAAAGKI